MSFFKQIESEAAILVNNGVYTQVDLYERDGYLYAKHCGGFVRLMADGATSKPKLRLAFMTFEDGLARDPLGKLCRAGTPKAKPLTQEASVALLGGPA